MAKHLKFRKLKKSDFKDVFEYGSDPDVVKYLKWKPMENITDAKMAINLLKAKKGHIFAVVIYGKMMGTGSIFVEESNKLEVEVVLNKEVWGMGIGHMTLLQLINFSTLWYKGYTLYANINLENEAAIQLFKKAGFKKKKTNSNCITFEIKII